MTRRTQNRLLLLAALLGAAVLLSGRTTADPPKKDDRPTTKTTTLAARPKVLSRNALAGLAFLVKQQQPNGGWGSGDPFNDFGGFMGGAGGHGGAGVVGFGVLGAGGGMPGVGGGVLGAGGGMVGVGGGVLGAAGGGPGVRPRPGQPTLPAVQTDVANTSIAALALFRAGYSPQKGLYSRNLTRALLYVLDEVEKADKDSMAVSGAPDGQVQRKIGANVDAFLLTLMLTEARGKMADAKTNQRVEDALAKVMTKVQKNQKDDGTWGDAVAWAPVLGQALGSRALNRAHQVGQAVAPEKLARSARHSQETFEKARGGRDTLAGAAGVQLYAVAASIAGMHDALSTQRLAADVAGQVLLSPSSGDEEKAEARKIIKRADETEKAFIQAVREVALKVADPRFLAGFGNDGGEEVLSFLFIGEALRARGSARDWAAWDRSMTERLTRGQAADGSWAGSHGISGKTFCTAAALLTLMADRAPVSVLDRPK